MYYELIIREFVLYNYMEIFIPNEFYYKLRGVEKRLFKKFEVQGDLPEKVGW